MFADALTARLAELDIDAPRLRERLSALGQPVSRQRLWNWQHKQTPPDPRQQDLLRALCDALEWTPEQGRAAGLPVIAPTTDEAA